MKFLILFLVLLNIIHFIDCRSFYIDNGKFIMNGDSSGYQIISGSFHYFRCHPLLWNDRLKKIKGSGLNTIQTYIPWNLHQPNGLNSELDFSAFNLTNFLELALDNELNVIIRPGPFACAEYEFGGLPSWLLSEYPTIALRSSDENFINSVTQYWSKLLPLLERYLFTNGGPIIMVQLENEYGSYGADKNYLQYLFELYQKYLGSEQGNQSGVIFHSTDGPAIQMLYGSKLNGVFQTVDFGPTSMDQIEQNFNIQQKYSTIQQPSMNSEYYTGWITHWTDQSAARTSSSVVSQGLDDILSLGASVNMYMFYGGSNFGFKNGANSNSQSDYEITIQSYDYDSPISEAGDITEKYLSLRNVIEKYINTSSPLPPIPENSTKIAYGSITFTSAASLFDNIGQLCKSPFYSTGKPLSMEEMNQSTGFVLYETTMNLALSNQLSIMELHDRATFYVNDQDNQGFLQRPFNSSLTISFPTTNISSNGDFNLKILLENQGRVNYGPYLHDIKGLGNGVLSSNQYLGPWTNYPIPLDDISLINDWQDVSNYNKFSTPTFYKAILTINNSSDIGDTFLSFENLGKGQLFVNGYNVGRYWNVGPQRTIYIPSVLLTQGDNEIILFETLSTNQIINIQFLNFPIFN